MGAGRKTETVVLQKKPPPQRNSNTNPYSARNLSKKDLAGVIFGCKHSTYKECMSKLLFGLLPAHFQYVRNVTQGMTLFLFNYSDRKLHGIFEAVSAGQMRIDPYAWTSDDQEETPFPAQVRVKVRLQCLPLTEDQYQPVLAENYRPHYPNCFSFELDASQNETLISLFSAFPSRRTVSVLHPVAEQAIIFQQPSDLVTNQENLGLRNAKLHLYSCNSKGNDKEKQKLEADLVQDAAEKHGNDTSSFEGKTWSSLFKPEPDSISKEECSYSKITAFEAHTPCHNPFSMLSDPSCSELFPDGEKVECEVLSTIGVTKEVAEQASSSDSKKAALEAHISCQNPYSTLGDPSCSELFPDGEIEELEVLSNKGITNEVVEQASGSVTHSQISEFSDTVDAMPSLTEIFDQIAQAADMLDDGEDTKNVAPSVQSKMVWGSSVSLNQMHDIHSMTLESTSNPMSYEEGHMINEASIVWSHFHVSEIMNAEKLATIVAEASSGEALGLAEEVILRMDALNLQTTVSKLIRTVDAMKFLHLFQSQKIKKLEKELTESNRMIEELRPRSGISLSSYPAHSPRHGEETKPQGSVPDSNQCILLLGGFDGFSWLPDLDSYLPSKDVTRSLEPMSSVRSYISAVMLNSGLYVLGGGCETSWYNTVELYNLHTKRWVSCPSLNSRKGSLAGACLSDKIFAIGGGNSAGCLSEVEVLDPSIGKWIFTCSMMQKRFAPAAAEMNGALYVAGGYDGQEYLKSVERFDPRRSSWMRLTDMTTRRGCHSLVVMNEKLYAVGGFDEHQMVPTVEIYEPRRNSWMMSEPMTFARGCMGTVVLGNSILVIGGTREDNKVLDVVERYTERDGWQLTDMKSAGKRCFLSAVVV